MRSDIKEAVYMEKKERIAINYAEVARQYGCDYRTVKKYYETQQDEPVLRKARIVQKKTDGFEEIISTEAGNDFITFEIKNVAPISVAKNMLALVLPWLHKSKTPKRLLAWRYYCTKAGKTYNSYTAFRFLCTYSKYLFC